MGRGGAARIHSSEILPALTPNAEESVKMPGNVKKWVASLGATATKLSVPSRSGGELLKTFLPYSCLGLFNPEHSLLSISFLA